MTRPRAWQLLALDALVSRLRHGRDYQEEDEEEYDDDEMYDEREDTAFAPDLDAAAAARSAFYEAERSSSRE